MEIVINLDDSQLVSNWVHSFLILCCFPVGFGSSLTQPDERLRWRDRRDSNPKSSDAQSHSEKGIPPLSPEALTQILTQIFGEDRQMLTRIVERWGSLSDELKRAVLAVVG